MKRFLIVTVLAAVFSLHSFAARAQCTKDIDCRGERICVDGECVDPPTPAPAPEPAPPPAPVVVYTQPAPVEQAPAYHPAPAAHPAHAPSAPRGPLQWFEKGYGLINFAAVPKAWGGVNIEDDDGFVDLDYDVDAGFWGGVYIGGYGVASENFHIGGFWSYYEGDLDSTFSDDSSIKFRTKTTTNNLGLSMRFGGRAAERIWIGGALDLALMITTADYKADVCETEPMVGLSTFPRFVLDVMLFNAGGFKMAVNTGVGAYIAPVYGGYPLDNDDCGAADDWRYLGWLIGPAFMMGLSLGG